MVDIVCSVCLVVISIQHQPVGYAHVFLQYIMSILASLQDTHWGEKWLYSLNIGQFPFKLSASICTTHTDRHLTVSQTLLYELQKFQGGEYIIIKYVRTYIYVSFCVSGKQNVGIFARKV